MKSGFRDLEWVRGAVWNGKVIQDENIANITPQFAGATSCGYT